MQQSTRPAATRLFPTSEPVPRTAMAVARVRRDIPLRLDLPSVIRGPLRGAREPGRHTLSHHEADHGTEVGMCLHRVPWPMPPQR